MTIFLLIQESQNEHGYIDTSLREAFTEQRLADVARADAENEAVEHGEQVDGFVGVPDGEWTVSFRVQSINVFRAAITSAESQHYIETGELPPAELR